MGIYINEPIHRWASSQKTLFIYMGTFTNEPISPGGQTFITNRRGEDRNFYTKGGGDKHLYTKGQGDKHFSHYRLIGGGTNIFGREEEDVSEASKLFAGAKIFLRLF